MNHAISSVSYVFENGEQRDWDWQIDLGIKAQETVAKNFELVINSSLYKRIFVDDKCVNYTSLEIVRAKKIFSSHFIGRTAII